MNDFERAFYMEQQIARAEKLKTLLKKKAEFKSLIDSVGLKDDETLAAVFEKLFFGLKKWQSDLIRFKQSGI